MRYLAYMACTLIPLLLYILSNSFAVEEHAGATGRSLMEILSDNPTFPVRFMLKSFAGILVGGEELQELMRQGVLSSRMCYLIGMFVLLGYVYALYLNLRFKLYERTIFPMMLLVGGGLNHVIIFISRYIFESETYALSSRYALQFQVGILGLVLTFALAWNEGGGKRRVRQWLTAVFCLSLIHIYSGETDPGSCILFCLHCTRLLVPGTRCPCSCRFPYGCVMWAVTRSML